MNIPWNVSIVNTGLGLGSKTIANNSFVEKMRHDGLARPEKIVSSIGIKNRYIVGKKEDHEFLVKKSLDQTSWKKKTKPKKHIKLLSKLNLIIKHINSY